jgi:primosomal protein N'
VIAEVIPSLRLPRRFSFFDYQIPDSMEVGVGDLVNVLFHGREIVGVVRGIKLTSEARKLAPVRSVALREWCSIRDVDRLETISSAIAQSPSSLLHTISPSGSLLPTFRGIEVVQGGFTVKRSDVDHVTAILANVEPAQAIIADFALGVVLVHALQKSSKDQILVIVPTERDVELVGTGSMLHGHTKPRERASIAMSWRQGKIKLLVGTRLASLLPAQKLSAIVVLDSGNNEHASTRRNPRFDSREAAKLLALQHQARLFFVDPLPRLEELSSSSTTPQLYSSTTSSHLISLKNPLERTSLDLISATLLAAMEQALLSGKKVLLFLNRKGVAKRLQCGACGHIPLCGTCGNVPSVRKDDLVCAHCGTEMWLPEVCPSCGKAKIHLRGIGGAKVSDDLQKHFPSEKIGIIEKGRVENPDANILLVTEYFFSSFHKPFAKMNLGVIADLAGDLGLQNDDFRSAEETARKLSRLVIFAKRENAECIIQTWLPDIIQPMLRLDQFITAERELRERYKLPPFSYRYLLDVGRTDGDVGPYIDGLPAELKPFARPHGETLELRFPSAYGFGGAKSVHLLPDSIKITPDTSYASHESPPQPQ